MAQASSRAPGSLRTRLVSAAIGLPLLLLAVWAGVPYVAALAAAAAPFALCELYGLLGSAGAKPFRCGGVALGTALAAGAAAGGAVVLWVLVIGSGVTMALTMLTRCKLTPFGDWAATLGGAWYLGLPLATAVLLRGAADGLEWLALALLVTFATDTGAYAVGRLVGRTPMAPSVSPGKTWEGAAGGLAAALGASIGLVALLDLPLAALPAAMLGIGVAMVAQAGDLMESKLKRLAGAKESGGLIPGHGGLLDRLDSLVLVFPLVYYVSIAWPTA